MNCFSKFSLSSYLEFAWLGDACEGTDWGHGENVPHSNFPTLRGQGDDIVWVVTSPDQGIEVDLPISQLHCLVLGQQFFVNC